MEKMIHNRRMWFHWTEPNGNRCALYKHNHSPRARWNICIRQRWRLAIIGVIASRVKRNDIEISDSLGKFTTDVIGTWAFGNSLENYINGAPIYVPENLKKNRTMAYLPFGNGPRNCIVIKFGMMLARIGFVSLLRKHQFHCNSKREANINAKK